MSIPAISTNSHVHQLDLQEECKRSCKAADFRISTMVGHFFVTCAVVSGIAFAASGAPAALASFIICLVSASACYFPDEIGRSTIIFSDRYYGRRAVYIPPPPPRPIIVQQPILVDPRQRLPVGSTLGGPRHVVGGNHMF